MRFAKEQGIPAQGRGSATSSIVSYMLGISRVEPIRHNLLFERFINEGRTTYPDVDIDFSSERREEVIQYVYRRYGPEHTGMVCNLVTYRARSAVREVGYALGFPRPLVDRVAKALETYDSRDGPARPRGGRRVRRVLPAAGRGDCRPRPLAAERGRGARPRRRDGPAATRGCRSSARCRPGASRRSRTTRTRRRPFAWLGEPASADRDLRRLAGQDDRLAPRTAIRRGGTSDDEGGPGDSPASVAWLRAGRGTGYEADRDRLRPAGAHRAAGPSTPRAGSRAAAARARTSSGRPNHWDPAGTPRRADAGAARAHSLGGPRRAGAAAAGRAAARRSACPTGSAGSSSAPASTASRATSRSTRAGCS